jgi:hypothetical protein
MPHPTEQEVAAQRDADAATAMAEVLKELEGFTETPPESLPDALADSPDGADDDAGAAPEEEQVVAQVPPPVEKPVEKPPEPAPKGEEVLGSVLLKLMERLEKLEAGATKAPEPVRTAANEDQAPELTVAEIQDLMRVNPLEAYKRLGVNQADVARLALASALGDKAPPEIRQNAEKARLQHEVNQLKSQLTELKEALQTKDQTTQAQAQQTTFVKQVRDGLEQYVKKDISKHANVAVAFKADPAGVTEDIWQEIAKDAHAKTEAARQGRGPANAPLLSYEEAAKRVEENYVKLRKKLGANDDAKNVRPPARPKTKPVFTTRDATYEQEARDAVAYAVRIAKGEIKPE